jgi:hypothetical protein
MVVPNGPAGARAGGWNMASKSQESKEKFRFLLQFENTALQKKKREWWKQQSKKRRKKKLSLSWKF